MKPVANAIVWQDTRTTELVADLARDEGSDRYRAKTGLPLATYFSGPKIRWLLDELGLADRAARGELAFGTMDTWIAWHLTGSEHVTDVNQRLTHDVDGSGDYLMGLRFVYLSSGCRPTCFPKSCHRSGI